MKPTLRLVALLQGLVLAAALALAGALAPLPAVAALGLAGCGVLAATLASHPGRARMRSAATALVWLCVFVVPASVLLAKPGSFILDTDDALPAWLVMAAAGLGAFREAAGPRSKRGWRRLAYAWGLLGIAAWLGASYSLNQRGRFYAGLVAGLALLLLCKAWFRMSSTGIQAVNTLILLVVGLPAADLLMRPASRPAMLPEGRKRLYSYAAARKDPAALAQWWDDFLREWTRASRHICMRDPDRVLAWRLRPNSHAVLFQSRISINSKGFRGKEVRLDKGEAYRIVALGESTTFGFTLDAGQRPWPELLEEMIRSRLNPLRPVEVINAGIPGADLVQNLHRLPKEILPLKPDMIISYHGANGFHLMDKGIPPAYGRPPPAYRPRPLKLLADCEYRLKLLLYERRYRPGPSLPGLSSNLMETPYARAYRQLAETAQTNHIRLVLGNYSMAVNAQSDLQVIEFYRLRFPGVFGTIKANELHSRLVRQIAGEHPEICFVDTHPHLDGEHDKFIDTAHFTQDGDQQLAETFYAGIRRILEADLPEVKRP